MRHGAKQKNMRQDIEQQRRKRGPEHAAQPDAQAALQKLHRLCVFAKFVGDLGKVGKCLGIVRMQHPARLHGTLLRLTKEFEGVRQGVGSEKHLAVVKQPSHVFGL